MRDDRPLIRTRDDLLELIAHALRLQLSYLSKDQALAVADTILRTLKAARWSRPSRWWKFGCDLRWPWVMRLVV